MDFSVAHAGAQAPRSAKSGSFFRKRRLRLRVGPGPLQTQPKKRGQDARSRSGLADQGEIEQRNQQDQQRAEPRGC